MIIGLCGQAGSGKDTTADFLVKDHGFVKIALADPIKRAAKDWFNFTDAQLWGPSEMRNEPDLRYLISEGYAEAVGEQRAAALVAAQHDDQEAVAEHKRRAASYAREAYLTPRRALQQMGTEVGRRCYQDVWVEYAMRVAAALLKKDYVKNARVNRYDAHVGVYPDAFTNFTGTPMDNLPLGVVISDVRFRNEVAAIRAAGGYVWRIERPTAGLEGAAAVHQSEREQAELAPELFTYTLVNDGDLEKCAGLASKGLEWTQLCDRPKK